MLLASFRPSAPRPRRLAHHTFRQGLAVATAGLAFVGSATATDLIVNGSFEADGDFASAGTPTGWTGFLKTYANGTDLYSEGPSIPATENPGGHYTWQHRAVNGVDGAAGVPQVTQRVDLTGGVNAADLDAGQGQYTFSGWLASYGQPNQNPEQPLLTVQFFRADSTQIGSTVSLDRTLTNYWAGNAGVSGIIPPSDPGAVTPNRDNHHWAKYSRTGLIPAGARSAVVGIGRSANANLAGSPDTYVDLVKFDVVKCFSPITNGLVAHLKFDGDYSDQAGYGVVGEPVSTGSLDTTLPDFAPGRMGQAVHILNTRDLTTNRVVALGPGYPDVLKFGSDATGDTSDFSVSFWVNYTHSEDDQAYLSNKNWDSGGNQGLVLASQASGGFKWNYKDSISPRRDSPNVHLVRDGQWHNLVMTFKRTGVVSSYLDGTLLDTTSMAPDPGNAVGSLDTDTLGLRWFIGTDGRGAYTDGNNAEIDMLFDDLGIWRRVLSAAEAREIFSKGVSGLTLEQCAPETTTILAQPQSRTVFVGFKASFSVLAAGGDPLTYQWVHNNQPINGETDATYRLSNVQPAAAGTYAVIITGAGGSIRSVDATLTVNPVPPCDLTPGLVVHMAFDGDYTDQAGYGVVGEPLGTGTIDTSLPTFAAGKLGQAVHVVNSRDLATNTVVRLGPGYPDVLKFGSDATSDATDFSISFWVNFTHNADDQAFISNKNWDSGNNFGLVIASQGNGGFKWNLRDNGGSGRRDSPNVTFIRDGTWHSMIMVFARRGNVISYLDGEVVDVTSMAPSGSPLGSLDTADQALNWFIGTDGRGAYTDGNAAEIDMLFDDLGIWRRQLTATEVACIYSGGQAGTALPKLGPKLQLKDLGLGDWQVFWAPSITGYILQSSPTLGPGAVWSEEFTLDNSLTVGTYDPTALIKFFRLKQSP
jgi:hypothetical protein